MNVNVINQIREEVKQFNSLEEFDLYYSKHKDEMDNKTTQYLNKVYKIRLADGTEYRITKKNCVKQDGKLVQGDIHLKKVVTRQNQDDSIQELMFANLQVDITNLRNELDLTKKQLADLVKQLDALNDKVSVINESIAVIPNIKNSLNDVIRVINSSKTF